MEKRGLIITVVMAILMVVMVVEAGDRYSNSYSPTLDAWRMAGYRNGYNAALRGEYPTNENNLDYMQGYRDGSRDQYGYSCRQGYSSSGYQSQPRITIPLPPPPPWFRR